MNAIIDHHGLPPQLGFKTLFSSCLYYRAHLRFAARKQE
jgi:hypothetical protein